MQSQITAMLNQALTLSAQGRLPEAMEIFRQVLAVAPGNFDALHGLGVAQFQLGNLGEALRLFEQAGAIRPQNFIVHYNQGKVLDELHRYEEALACYDRAAALEPSLTEACFNRGTVLQKLRRNVEALESYERAITLRPGYAEAYNNRGNVLRDLQRLDEALASYDRAIALRPDYAEAHVNRGAILRDLQRPAEALASHDRALALRPDLAEAYNNRGNVLRDLQRFEEALASYDRAIALRPDYAEAHYHRGNVLRDLQRFEEALASCDRAIALNPDYAEAHNNRGIVCEYLNRPDEALASYGRAIALKPDYAEAYHNQGLAYYRQHKLDQAVHSYRQALAHKPGFAAARCSLGVSLAGLGRMEEALRCLDESLAIDATLFEAYSARLFVMLYSAATQPAGLLAVQRLFAGHCETPLKAQWRRHVNSPDPERRLRIGYVSADFCRHSVARFIEPLLACHDHARVEVCCYYNNFRSDEVTERIAAQADRWFACAHLTDEQLAERIRHDGIDILIDLSGHTSGNRLLTFARKPAPVQVTYLGYPASTGLAAMDYRLCTADTDPPGQEAWHSEALYRLPRSLWCYRPPAAQARVPQDPPLMRNGYVTFGSVNNVVKVSPETITAWAQILQAVPGSRLVMTSVPDGVVREALVRRITAQGVAPERVRLHDRLPHADYWQLLRQIDIALDPFPYTGTTTTCETLWMGVPVVTLVGRTSVARSGYALLQSVGLAELAAVDTADYVARAIALASDPERLGRLHEELPARFDASALRDEAGLARDIETAFREMWRKWCQTRQEG